jgi:hypothetical protein
MPEARTGCVRGKLNIRERNRICGGVGRVGTLSSVGARVLCNGTRPLKLSGCWKRQRKLGML